VNTVKFLCNLELCQRFAERDGWHSFRRVNMDGGWRTTGGKPDIVAYSPNNPTSDRVPIPRYTIEVNKGGRNA
jgi:hypothetical protein